MQVELVPFYSCHWCLLLIFSQLFQSQAYLIRNEWLYSFSDDDAIAIATVTELWIPSRIFKVEQLINGQVIRQSFKQEDYEKQAY